MSRKHVIKERAVALKPADPNCRHATGDAKGPCPCERSCSCRSRDRGPCPIGAEVYWLTRDSDLAGALEDYCDVWTSAPIRLPLDSGAYWMHGEWDLDGHYGRYRLTTIQKRFGVIPETDRESIRCG